MIDYDIGKNLGVPLFGSGLFSQTYIFDMLV